MLGCNEKCTVSYKAYQPYYIPKKKSRDKQSYSPPRWHLYAIEKHIQQGHNQGIPNPTSGAGHSEEETSPDLNRRENQDEDSSNGIATDNPSRDHDLQNLIRSLPESDGSHSQIENITINTEKNQTQKPISTKRAFPDFTKPDLIKRTKNRK